MTLLPHPESLQRQVEEVEREARRTGVTLFGAGGFARATRAALREIGVQVHAFVVSASSGDAVDGIPVVQLADLDDATRRLPMWVAVFNHSRTSDLLALKAGCVASGIARVLLPQQYFEVVQQQMGWRYWLADRRAYHEHEADIAAALAGLADAESRRQFSEAVAFRVASPGFGAPLPSAEAHYFPERAVEELLRRRGPLVLVDGGAYDGDTIALAASKLSTWAHAFAFEPDSSNFESLVRNVRSLEFPVTCVPCGLSDATATATFSVGQGAASAIGAGGETHIQCVALEQFMGLQRVDYVKLDVEGHELAALQGALAPVRRWTPVLAVAAYHRWDDMWRIPRFFRSCLGNYRLTYRAHEYNSFDGVFYAIAE